MSALTQVRHLRALLSNPKPLEGGGVGKCVAALRASLVRVVRRG